MNKYYYYLIIILLSIELIECNNLNNNNFHFKNKNENKPSLRRINKVQVFRELICISILTMSNILISILNTIWNNYYNIVLIIYIIIISKKIDRIRLI